MYVSIYLSTPSTTTLACATRQTHGALACASRSRYIYREAGRETERERGRERERGSETGGEGVKEREREKDGVRQGVTRRQTKGVVVAGAASYLAQFIH